MDSLLRSQRDGLSDSTIKTYTSNIKSLYRKMNPNEPYVVEPDKIFSFFKSNNDKVLSFLKDVPPPKRKTILASLVVLCNKNKCVDLYRKQMLKDAMSYNNSLKDQSKTETQKKSWITQEEVLKVYRKLYRTYSSLFNKEKLDKDELQDLQDLVILSLYVLIPPRRLLDYTAFKLRNINKTKDNFMNGKTFVFNTYKTAKKYNTQNVDIPQKLKNIVSKWATKHTNDFLLFDENGNPLPTPKLTLKLNRIFGGRRISVNQLRHTFISDEVLPDVPILKKLQSVADDMGHSVDQQMLYKKV